MTRLNRSVADSSIQASSAAWRAEKRPQTGLAPRVPDTPGAKSACRRGPIWGKAETGRGRKEAAIAIVAAPVALAFVAWLAALVAGRAGGVIRLAAQAVAVVLASFAGALAGFLIPLAPLPEGAVSPALLAGVLGTLGTILGMSAAEWLLARLDRRG